MDHQKIQLLAEKSAICVAAGEKMSVACWGTAVWNVYRAD
jgi:hypothetical protein